MVWKDMEEVWHGRKGINYLAVILVVLVYILLIYALLTSIRSGSDTLLILLLIVALIVMVPIAIFLVDLAVYEPG